MTTTDSAAVSQPFQAEVSELLHLMVHSVYSETDIFLRELISNASDACDKLRYEAIAKPELVGEDDAPKIRIIPIDPILPRRIEDIQVHRILQRIRLMRNIRGNAQHLTRMNHNALTRDQKLQRALQNVSDLLVVMMV